MAPAMPRMEARAPPQAFHPREMGMPQKKPEPVEKKPCHLHSKPNKKCKFCQKLLEAQAEENDARSGAAGKSAGGKGMAQAGMQDPCAAVTAGNFGLSAMLSAHIQGSAHYKEVLNLVTFEQVVGEMRQYGESIEPYLPNSNTTPSALFCCLYRLVTLGINANQLLYLLECDDNPRIRCVGFLFVRFGLPPAQLWPWLGEYVLDNEVFSIQANNQDTTTVGEFVERLLIEERYFSIVYPRLPMAVKRKLQENLAPVPQYRKRGQANLDYADVYRDGGVAVEINKDGQWQQGRAIALLENKPSRLKVLVKMMDETEEEVLLGKVILTDRSHSRQSGGGAKRGRNRSRSPRRDDVDWAHERGRTDHELIDELRTKDREKATTSGKDYARRPLGFKASCAMPQEMGAAVTKLTEEETFVSDRGPSSYRSSRRSPSPQQAPKAQSAEHQAQMKKLFEKYGMQKPTQTQSQTNDLQGPDFMRLG